jgi:peroxiredoxin
MQSSRLGQLQERWAQLAAEIPDSPQKEALSVLHGMLQEIRRGTPAAPARSLGEMSLERVANLYKTAPTMDGVARSEPLAVGTPAPDFTLRDAANREVSLRDFRGSNVVVVFYPLDWSPTCSDQLSLYEAEKGEFERLGATVVAISVDSIYSHGAWAAVRGLTIPLLSDFEPKGEVARRYEVYREDDGFSERALYVIDGDGVIRHAHVSPELGKIPDIYELYRVLAEISGVGVPESSETSSEPALVGGVA